MNTDKLTHLRKLGEKVFSKDHAPRFKTARDVTRLEVHMTCSRKLNEMLVLDAVTDEDLKRMILIERTREQGPRPEFIKKLLGRLQARGRADILKRLAKCPDTVN